MKSLILQSSVRVVAPLLLLFSVFAFIRGHNDPGGGFIAGLIAACAFALILLAEGLPAAQQALRWPPRTFIAVGLMVALISAVVGPAQGLPLLTGVWVGIPTPLGTAKVGTPVLFDLGVYLVVLGSVLTFLYTLAHEGDA